MSLKQQEPDLAVSVRRCQKVWRTHGYHVGAWLAHGPSGFKFRLAKDVPVKEGSVIVSQAPYDGADWIHASLAWVAEMPHYYELTTLHLSTFGPKRFAYQMFVSADQHVNIHQNALHLWGRTDGRNVLPNFGEAGTI